ncbi:hypothetical protein D6T63_17540 [Arthrobacter cheniae]|uniref:Uncharacterized protein n=2 Tax=Arthrobacter cheniae TaxID=1258888 RepID=A0A3A5LX74_9MICC|nr:hypothetical protein D6T63_17540 [Arthrobacter cheniae]
MAAAVGIAEVVLMGGFIMVPQSWVLALIVAAQILVCAAMLAPIWPSVSWKLICGCAAPGLVLTGFTVIGGGYWAAFWLVGLPAWVMLCQRWSRYRLRRKFLEVLGFAGLYAGASLLFALCVYLPNPAALLLPLVPAAQLYFGALPVQRNLPALIGLVLSVGLVVLAALQPDADWGAPWSYAGAAVTGVLILASYTGRKSR